MRKTAAGPAPVWAWSVLGITVASMVAAYFLLPLNWFGPQRPVLSWTVLILALTLIAVLLLVQIWYVVTDREGTHPGIVILLLVCLSVLVFSAGYYGLAKEPGQFSGLHTRLDALYFTVVTLATVGYGDITAQGQTARVLVILQIVYNFVFLTAAATSLSRKVRSRLDKRLRRTGPR
ncbi:potassium channel family protein [Streptomyces sannanensis]|uniref:potassium channel family protein n=1 Tax=Streptomyces sannanensis TaxID=285536 RepID=UPI0031E98648